MMSVLTFTVVCRKRKKNSLSDGSIPSEILVVSKKGCDSHTPLAQLAGTYDNPIQ